MSKFGIITKDTPQVRYFLFDTVERLKNPDIKRNPYQSSLETYKHKDKLYTMLRLESLYPPIENLAYLSVLFILVAFLFHWANWLILVFSFATMIFVFVHFAKTSKFQFWVMRKGLRKKGYKDEIVFVSEKKLGGLNFGTNRNIRVFEKKEGLW